VQLIGKFDASSFSLWLTHDNVLYRAPKLEAAAQSVKADQGHWHSAFQKAKNRPLRVVSRVQDIHRNGEFSCTVPTQRKTCILSTIKTIGYKSSITREG
jgi:hypothetical protein